MRTQKEIDEQQWLNLGPALEERVNLALMRIYGRQVPFILMAFPGPEVTHSIQNAPLHQLRTGVEGALSRWDYVKTGTKR